MPNGAMNGELNSLDHKRERVDEIKPIFVIGAQKAGTSFLFSLLTQDRCIARSAKKEPQIFSKPFNQNLPFNSFFDLKPHHEYALDGSATYLHVHGTAEQISMKFGPNTPIFVILRNPIQRAVSGYMHEVKHGRELRTPDEVFSIKHSKVEAIVEQEYQRADRAWKSGKLQPHYSPQERYRDPLFQFCYLANSIYTKQLNPWINLFPNIHLIDFEQLKSAPAEMLKSVRDILHLSQDIAVDTNARTNNLNTTNLSFLSAVRQNRKLVYDYHRPSLAYTSYRLWKNLSKLGKSKPELPLNLREALMDDLSKVNDMWLDKWL